MHIFKITHPTTDYATDSPVISLFAAEDCKRTELKNLKKTSHLVLQSDALFCPAVNLRRDEDGSLPSHLKGFQFQSRSVCILLWSLVFVSMSPGNTPRSPHFVASSFHKKNFNFS